MRGCPLIVVCGCIGAGKTTAVELLGGALGYVGQSENYADNPFLERFYEDPRRWALSSQLYFLLETLTRTRGWARGRAKDGTAGGVIQELDTTLVLEVMSGELQARGVLAAEEMDLLRGAASVCEPAAPPDLYLHLDAETEVLRDRIRTRGRRMEQNIGLDQLTALRARYTAVLAGLQAPVLTVATDRLDIRDAGDRVTVVDAIERSLSGRRSGEIPGGGLSAGS
jgi:deoxyadenosine/deoxycytidine kinase